MGPSRWLDRLTKPECPALAVGFPHAGHAQVYLINLRGSKLTNARRPLGTRPEFCVLVRSPAKSPAGRWGLHHLCNL